MTVAQSIFPISLHPHRLAQMTKGVLLQGSRSLEESMFMEKFVGVGLMLFAVVLLGCQQRAAPIGENQDCGSTVETPCRASFRSLAASPSSYEERVVRLEGYLTVERETFVLYSSKELFEAGVQEEVAVKLRGPIEAQERIFNQHAYSWVSLVGKFMARQTDGTTEDLLLGEVHAPLVVRPLRSLGPPAKRTFGDVILDMEDLGK